MSNYGDYTIDDAASIIEEEGIGYAVQSYIGHESFEDSKLRKLWRNAEKALDELQEYIRENKS